MRSDVEQVMTDEQWKQLSDCCTNGPTCDRCAGPIAARVISKLAASDAALRAEVERLQAVLDQVNAHALAKMTERNAAESSLAVATELLRRVAALDTVGSQMAVVYVVADALRFLAAQPAATCCH